MSDVELSLETPIVSTVHHPFGSPSGPGLWHVKGMELPAYIQNIGHALIRTGRATSVAQAIQMAVGICKNWASGKADVTPQVRAAAAKAIAEWEAKKLRAHAQRASHSLSEVRMYDPWGNVIDLAAKLAKSAVNYRDATGNQKCGNCDNYSSGSCDIVAGSISPTDTCDKWTAGSSQMMNKSSQMMSTSNVRDGIDLATVPSPTAATRKSALAQGKALPHPSGNPGQARFPITNATLLGRAIRMVQLAKGDKTAIRRYIMAKARAMGLSSMIPAHWKPDGTIGQAP